MIAQTGGFSSQGPEAMAFGKRGTAQQLRPAKSPRRASETVAPAASVSDEPDIDVDPETVAEISAWSGKAQSQTRKDGKSTNLAMSLIVRGLLIFIVFTILVKDAFANGDINQLMGWAVFAMAADYVRVLRKALRSGA